MTRLPMRSLVAYCCALCAFHRLLRLFSPSRGGRPERPEISRNTVPSFSTLFILFSRFRSFFIMFSLLSSLRLVCVSHWHRSAPEPPHWKWLLFSKMISQQRQKVNSIQSVLKFSLSSSLLSPSLLSFYHDFLLFDTGFVSSHVFSTDIAPPRNRPAYTDVDSIKSNGIKFL